MSGSNWIDLIVVVLALFAAASGWRQGAVASALAFIGVILGAVAGILLVPHVLTHIDDSRTRVVVGVAVIIGLIILGEVAGMMVGRAARDWMQNSVARSVDSAVGAVFQAVAVLVAAWLLAVPLASSSQVDVAAAVRGSSVLSKVNAVAPPWLRGVPNRFGALLDTSGLPDVMGPFGRTPIASVAAPDPALAVSPVVARVRPSVLEIRGVAPSCQKALEGSGFVIAPGRVMTNAHVVAGTAKVAVETADGELPAKVVLFDPEVDIAILSVPGLDAPVLRFADGPARSGQDAIVLGYPGGGPFTASPARVRETITLDGPDIYHSATVKREVYTVRGLVRQGNSGGPLIDDQGRVLGVVFGAAVDDPETGFVLTAREVASQYARAQSLSATVGTGSCVA